MIKMYTYKKIMVQGTALGLAVIQLLGMPMQVFAVNEEIVVEDYEEQKNAEDEVDEERSAKASFISLDTDFLELEVGSSATLTVAAYNENGEITEAEFDWKSDDTDIAEVNESGMVTVKSAGQTTIIVNSGEICAECVVTGTVSITEITLDKSNITLQKGQSEQLAAKIHPDDTTENTDVKWTSSNTSVAVVDEKGLVTALGVGQANIYAETASEVSSVPCQIIVTSEEWYTGWKKVNSSWYYYDSNGNMKTGWQKVSGIWYYLSSSGIMQVGWQKVSGKWYYLNNSGAMETGWQKVSGKWYYLNNSGAMETGWQKISGKWYYLNSNGGWRQAGKKYPGSGTI